MKFIEGKLFLKVNRDKTGTGSVSGKKFQSYTFYFDKEGKCQLMLHPKTIDKLKMKLKKLTSRKWYGVCAAKRGIEFLCTRLGGMLQAGKDEIHAERHRRMAASSHLYMYMEELEESDDEDSQSHQM